MQSFNYMQTNYPQLYENVYWGMFKSATEYTNIYNNRNAFVSDFNINANKKYGRVLKGIIEELRTQNRRLFDHMEGYVTNHGSYIIFFSPYVITEEQLRLIGNYGFNEMYNMYSERTKTFFVEIANTRRFKHLLKNVRA